MAAQEYKSLLNSQVTRVERTAVISVLMLKFERAFGASGNKKRVSLAVAPQKLNL